MQLGGTLGKLTIEVKGDPVVSEGERYILFLQRDDRKAVPNTSGLPRYVVAGIWSGKMRIEQGKMVISSASHKNLQAYDGIDMDAFIRQLQETIRRPYTRTDLPIHPKR